eukprot:TRINITY_DN36865_c0_g4_i1.p1 TRINITY_DN36865_c0_g4~~TRINITY_DN36865_c0_g4_i1.p1  ORF type:complete len:140 (-),score=13.54 TRINITY_DN36865_c0_g4_i1:10-429(-)
MELDPHSLHLLMCRLAIASICDYQHIKLREIQTKIYRKLKVNDQSGLYNMFNKDPSITFLSSLPSSSSSQLNLEIAKAVERLLAGPIFFMLEEFKYWLLIFAKESPADPMRASRLKQRIQIGRAVQQECRDRSRMPSSA